MANVIEDIGKGLETAGEAVIKGIEKVVGIVDKTDKVLHTVIADEATLKPVLITAVKGAVALAGDVDRCITEKGLNLEDDEELLTAIKAYFASIGATLVPAIEVVYGDITADLK